jgi:hypothetical protein
MHIPEFFICVSRIKVRPKYRLCKATMFIVTTGADKDRSKQAGVDNPEQRSRYRTAGRLRVRSGRGR